MAYHMARVAHWAQNGTVRHYPTPYLPQLYHPPWAEFAITHFQLLSGGDRFANAVQWLAMIGSVLCTSLITKLLGGDSRAQIFAAVLAATIPMGILQGSSTQNDLVVTFWLLVFVSYVLRMMASSSRSQPDLLELRWQMMAAGASLGLAVLTKGTAYIYAMPFVLWLAFVMVKRLRLRAIPFGLVAGALVLLLNAGHFWRNVQLFGTPLSAGDESYVNEVFTPSAFVSNFIRNLSLHAGTPFAGVNEAMSVAVRRLHDALGIAVNDPRTTAVNDPRTAAGNGRDLEFAISRIDTVEDFAGNLLHTALILDCECRVRLSANAAPLRTNCRLCPRCRRRVRFVYRLLQMATMEQSPALAAFLPVHAVRGDGGFAVARSSAGRVPDGPAYRRLNAMGPGQSEAIARPRV